ncbi:MED6 mediator sub complex component-domain-containing protein [Xylariaceae sp. FL0804]|nr:MED6 mediator sub complex component-domain-containing protein [Xylariaceae sp. FL0804]
MAAPNDPPLDEIQWRHPQLAQSMQGIHSNSVLFYFAESPFYDRTSNNAVLASQAMFNPAMFHLIQTREAFEGRLRDMSGLEFLVAQEPAEMAPGTGTGVWVIRKQTRRKRDPAQGDDLAVHATYYVVGDNIYMAPTLAQILSFRMTAISSSLSKCFPAADEARTWSPSLGHVYKPASDAKGTARRPRGLLESKDATPAPGAAGGGGGGGGQADKGLSTPEPRGGSGSGKAGTTEESALQRLAEQSFVVHMQHGGDYMDENPITGRPGEFHLSSTGRRDKLQIPGLTALDTSLKGPPTPEPGSGGAGGAGGGSGSGSGNKKDGKAGEKTPKTPTGSSKSKRRKKSAATNAAATTPVAS